MGMMFLKDAEENQLKVQVVNDLKKIVALTINERAMIILRGIEQVNDLFLEGLIIEDTCDGDFAEVQIKAVFSLLGKTLNIVAKDGYLIDRNETFKFNEEDIKKLMTFIEEN